MARGNRREAILLDDEDRRFFLKAVSEACTRSGWRVHAWVLMGNHYHLFIETREANLSAGMKWLQNTCTRRFNVRHRKLGRVFGDRLGRRAVLEERARCGKPVLEAGIDARRSHLRRGWYRGTQAFAEKMLHAFRPLSSGELAAPVFARAALEQAKSSA